MEKIFICSPTEPIVKTGKGAVRGFYFDGVYTFRGVPYAKAARFMPPEPMDSWEGVRDALVWGYTPPVPTDYMFADDFTVPHRFWPQSEACQVLNIWTQSLDKTAKKPVMVWIHGGGFYNGSSMEMIAYDGDEISKSGDVVLVSVNHRLNYLGFFDLSSFGKEYKNSGNLGLQDLVMSLRWIQENISAFGGDPDNVTIFGQSGGGGKVTALLQTQEADGLFHKAIIQSGVFGSMSRRGAQQQQDRKVAERMLELLGYPTNDVKPLESVPLDELHRVYNKACLETYGPRMMWPCGALENEWFSGDPMDVGFTEHAKTIPMMIGTVIAEMGYHKKLPVRDEISAEDTKQLICDEYGEEDSDEIINEFKKAYPDKAPVYALYLSNRQEAIEYCRKKASVSSAPVFNYQFALTFPYDGGTPAWHCAEIPFIFHNAERIPLYHIPGVTEKLENIMSSAWTNFAHNGDPSGGPVGTWSALKADEVITYVFDTESGQREPFYDQKLMELVEKNQKPRGFF